jgi:3-oxoacyl-[acyl-carrier-protein] synthase II
MSNRPRVVVTGIGVVTSVGIGVQPFWRNLLAGESGIGHRSPDTRRYGVHLGGEVKKFVPADYVKTLPTDSIARASQLAIMPRGSRLRMGLAPESMDPATVGVSIGTTSGEPEMIERFDDRSLQAIGKRSAQEFIGRYPCHVTLRTWPPSSIPRSERGHPDGVRRG